MLLFSFASEVYKVSKSTQFEQFMAHSAAVRKRRAVHTGFIVYQHFKELHDQRCIKILHRNVLQK